MKPYIQFKNQQTTLENWKLILTGNTFNTLAAFAYATDSGVAKLQTQLRNDLENTRNCRWIFSLDYGRTQPTALRKLNLFANSSIRIYDGEYVVKAKSFKPRTSYHLKTALTLQPDGYPCKQIVGSGNLSGPGLISGIEAGSIVDYQDLDREFGNKIISTLEELWEHSTPLENIIDEYEEKYSTLILPSKLGTTPSKKNVSLFWIDVGYVTKNRGNEKPGNQFDLPKNSHIYLGIKKARNPTRNSILGSLNLKTPINNIINKNLRLGNNDMEKLTLPIPEDNGYDSYDGKILTFALMNNEVELEEYEPEDFYRIFGRRINYVNQMRSGRKYGTIL